MPKDINVREVRKIARLCEHPRPNLPTPAVLVVCCLIDTLARNYAGNRCERFGKYIEERMKRTFQQLRNNDSVKGQLIHKVDCSFEGHEKNKRCKTSLEILYRHVRCGLVHDYFESEGYRIINRQNEKQQNVVVDQSTKYSKYALVLNGPSFVRDFLATL